MTELEKLRLEVTRLRAEMDAMLRIFWDMRGQAKAATGRIEKELDVAFHEYLERQKISAIMPTTE